MKFLISAIFIDNFSYPSSVRPNKTKSFLFFFNFSQTLSTLSGVIRTHLSSCGFKGFGFSMSNFILSTATCFTSICLTSFFQRLGKAQPLANNGNKIRIGKCWTFTIYFTFCFCIDFFFCSFCS